MTLATSIANANLQVTTSSSLGAKCYSENPSMQLIRCYCGSTNCNTNLTMNLKTCAGTYAQNSSDPCYVNTANGWGYFCDNSSIDACFFCAMTDTTSSWTITTPYTKHIVKRTVFTHDTSNRYECPASTSKTKYGCEKGYYTYDSTGSTSMTCNKCPNTGTSENGNLAITGCYIPAEGTFSDDTGSGTVTDKCYYQN